MAEQRRPSVGQTRGELGAYVLGYLRASNGRLTANGISGLILGVVAIAEENGISVQLDSSPTAPTPTQRMQTTQGLG
jgi:hypothetical protein